MHSELSYGLSFASKLQRVATMRLSGSHQPTPDPSFRQYDFRNMNINMNIYIKYKYIFILLSKNKRTTFTLDLHVYHNHDFQDIQ